MAERVAVSPTLLSWALDRSGLTEEDSRYERFSRWAAGDEQPTFRQLETFATATHAPLGYLFLPSPPVEKVPIPDFRTMGNAGVSTPSPDLLDTIYESQMRHDWYRSYAVEQDYDPLPFVGSANVNDPVIQVADDIRRTIGFTMDERPQYKRWEDALRRLIDAIESVGVLVMVSGIVGGNTRRKLNPEEFRGFALTDPMASLVFVNGADSKAAQIFTMVHELAHVWLGETALSEAGMATQSSNAHEQWANQVAAEVLVPIANLRKDYRQSADLAELQRLAKLYKVSTLVVLKRIHDAGFLKWDDYQERYATELARVREIMAIKSSGGNYYDTQPLRVSQNFARAVIVDALEGRTLFRDAYGLLGAAKRKTFDGLAEKLGVA
ncbi:MULTISPECIES: ImmA/IrrE family metallo-endopeptidase [unclassified Microbacterium]|uniref:ImmA/IrrE family metallo-endopeptidase n=1 Tax=unclassified Microbacterium TaxID=2609290 RepID=UPI002468D969|nr:MULTISPECIES: ImmA/IrrE family metallo-endopeptidase [unclassified Microbacterium]MDH5134610.1 ImmA/IrrE family metallo-endopeptidase [Microbacterium sp. RD10]MDH5138164.1 ImmA/IrrE family metallo-endopeptidase [Microbacterium sp. RD11]MDH5146116.1 ImmA/IrrE family metallo-endopeptidase [Microbacterium sp. RD12]MDH5156165.1 ImmA/IrrE family metallo-endopeptidase [Microbacterium sp. RD06]MDH5168003.1 ImmA/IrrE family metallo-endopeptidase [Microbacterium sp. RD02]